MRGARGLGIDETLFRLQNPGARPPLFAGAPLHDLAGGGPTPQPPAFLFHVKHMGITDPVSVNKRFVQILLILLGLITICFGIVLGLTLNDSAPPECPRCDGEGRIYCVWPEGESPAVRQLRARWRTCNLCEGEGTWERK